MAMEAVFPTYARRELEIVQAKGTVAIDQNGKEYLDFIAGIAVCNLGHCHEQVTVALIEQAERVWQTSNLFQNHLQTEVAEMLTNQCDGEAVFFCNSGAEANEAAIKLARKYTGRERIITFKQSFHGRTFATMSATGQEKIQQGYGTLLHEFHYALYNDFPSLANEMDENVAAVMLEIVQGEGGVIPAQKEFLENAERLCKRVGALLIVDEIQTGIGRTGNFFAYQHYGISPDIMTVAKALANGFPVGAMIGKKKLINSFGPGSHGSTFGGNWLAMAAAKATLSIIAEKQFLKDVQLRSSHFYKQLVQKLSKFDEIVDIRGLGFLIGIECKHPVAPLICELEKNGLLLLQAGEKVLRLLPPLTVSHEELAQALNIMVSTLETYRK